MATIAESAVGRPVQANANILSVDLTGPAGRLEALLNSGAPDAPFAALVCHPHPLFGGTMHNKVVYHAMKVLNDPAWGFGFPVLRFNFRGSGLSEGAHDGRAEAGDVEAALGWLENAYNRPVILAGFSFGATMAASAACGSSGPVRALALLGLPVNAGGSEYRYPELATCSMPKLFLSGNRDQFASPAQLTQVAAEAAQPRQLTFVSEADHFFSGRLEQMQTELAGWTREIREQLS